MLLGTLSGGPDLDLALDAGALGVVGKPFSNATLIPAIEMAVARHVDTTERRAQIVDISKRLETRKVIVAPRA